MAQIEVATLAGGCFWGMEDLLRKLPGVLESEVGYTGGTVPNATYELVKTGKTGHAEAIQLRFDPQILSYENLLLFFFKIHDPTTEGQQGNDIGSQYRSAIFYHSENQREIAQEILDRVNKSKAWKFPLVTEIKPLEKFYRAEDYHQDYLEKHPAGYTCHFLRNLNF
ncbi:MAG TPA: peptide-methionine (S)-S-oxide reductase MsrA [Pseudobdellovibrionaceae bacterium]|jgi:methionine-S-sulfoxide reductase